MGVAKAALEASVRYMAEDLGKKRHPRQFHFGRPDQDPGRRGHRRFPLHPEMERTIIRRCAAPSRTTKWAMRRCILLSDLGSAVTGECLHVDAGYHVVGMKAEDAPDIAVAPKHERLSSQTGVTLYFARHGETEANLEKRFSGEQDTPLTDAGPRAGARSRRDPEARTGAAPATRLCLQPAARAPAPPWRSCASVLESAAGRLRHRCADRRKSIWATGTS